jgi:LL-H family phage holin
MNEVLFKIILGLISILGIIITSVVVPYIKEKLGNEKLAKYEYWVSMAVGAAEMIFKEQGMGKTKKEYVVNFLKDMFNKNKIVITNEQLEILVESAVKQMKLNEEK